MTEPTTPRAQLLASVDFSACQMHGYATPEGLLAAYDASRTQAADPTAVRAAALREAVDRLAGLYAADRERRTADQTADRYRTAWHSARGRTARAKDARDYWHYELRNADARILELERKLRPTTECSCAVLRTGPGRHLPECPHRSKRPPMDPAHILGLDADDETPAAETQPEACPPGCIACATDESHDPAPAAGARQDEPDHVCNSVMARGHMDEPMGYYICGVCGKRKGGAQQ